MPQPELWSDTQPEPLPPDDDAQLGERARSAACLRGDGRHPHLPLRSRTAASSINGEPRTLKGVCLPRGCRLLSAPPCPPKSGCAGCSSSRTWAATACAWRTIRTRPELYRLCDALGFFVIDEAFDEWENAKNKWWQGHNVYPPRHQGYAKDFHAWHERDLEAMIDAHRNHPSIIAWSIGNEIDYPNDPYAARCSRR